MYLRQKKKQVLRAPGNSTMVIKSNTDLDMTNVGISIDAGAAVSIIAGGSVHMWRNGSVSAACIVYRNVWQEVSVAFEQDFTIC